MVDSPTVCCFESRRAAEMEQLVVRHGGRPMIAPSMREVPLENNQQARDGIQSLTQGQVDCVILLTGVGTTAMLDLARSCQLEQQLLEQLQRLPVVVRGPKPAAVLHGLGLRAAARAESPNTWRELLKAIDEARISLSGQTIAVQEYGVPATLLNEALRARGAEVCSIPVYRWELPEDLQPLERAVQATVAGDTQLTLFTSAQQIRHVLQVADRLQLRDAWLGTVPRVASIGPTCSEALREFGIEVWLESDPPKMGPLVRGALEKYRG